jgi:hypothetical protein
MLCSRRRACRALIIVKQKMSYILFVYENEQRQTREQERHTTTKTDTEHQKLKN